MNCELAIIGAGIVGAATALEMKTRYPELDIAIFDKECKPAAHQTGRNSGVIHAGIYYKPGSKKAQFCKAGNAATKAFCDEHDIPYETCGKLLVATSDVEVERMQALYERTAKNAVERHWVDAQEMKAREPNVTGLAGIFVPSSGIVNYAQIAAKMLSLFEARGGRVYFNHAVADIAPKRISFESGVTVSTQHIITCAGIQSDRIVEKFGETPDFVMCPFRGEYYQLPLRLNDVVKHLIYPIPDPAMPFLGVHLTRMIDGSITVGPNAVLALGREAYKKTDISLPDLKDALGASGVRRALLNHWKAGLVEYKNSLWKPGYLKLVQKYCPKIQLSDLHPYPAGIRAQAVSHNGDLVDDFLFVETEHALVVANAPSPAATSAIPIAQHIADQVRHWYGERVIETA